MLKYPYNKKTVLSVNVYILNAADILTPTKKKNIDWGRYRYFFAK